MKIGHRAGQAFRQSLRLLRSPSIGLCRTRNLSVSCHCQNWRNETPPGGLTEILVYTPESQIAWPDTSLGIFAQADPRFVLPGNVGLTAFEQEEFMTEAQNDSANESKSAAKSSVIPARVKVD